MSVRNSHDSLHSATRLNISLNNFFGRGHLLRRMGAYLAAFITGKALRRY
jgi:hypothetical protein